jgi:hypothetical protein
LDQEAIAGAGIPEEEGNLHCNCGLEVDNDINQRYTLLIDRVGGVNFKEPIISMRY